MFWIVSFALSWLFGFLFADKKRWREILPVAIFASWLSFIVEAWMHYVFKLWSYSGNPIFPLFGNAFGIYIVVPYFFIQWLPQERTIGRMVFYFFLWTGFAILFEFFHWRLLRIEYHLWWNMGCSYISDWLLFGILYNYYVMTNLKKLSK